MLIFYLYGICDCSFLSLKSIIPQPNYSVHFDSKYPQSVDSAYMLISDTTEGIYFHFFFVNENQILSDMNFFI